MTMFLYALQSVQNFIDRNNYVNVMELYPVVASVLTGYADELFCFMAEGKSVRDHSFSYAPILLPS
jgi:hypothetical protein